MTPEITSSAAGDAADPAAALRHAFRLLENAQRHLRATVAADIGLGVSELTALEAVAELPDLTPKWLGLELALSTGAVTALLDRLARAGFVDRVANPRDRRSVLLRLTDAGSALLVQVNERYDAVSAEVLRASPGLAEEEAVEDIARAAAVITARTIG